MVLSSDLVRTQPLAIDGLAGPVVLAAGALSSRYSVTVGGVEAKRTGRFRYALPTAAGGTVEATVRNRFADTYPTVEINGVKHLTGPPLPLALRILALIPFALIGFGGALGGLVGGLGVVANLAIARQSIATGVKALSMVGVLLVTAVVWLLAATAVTLAIT